MKTTLLTFATPNFYYAKSALFRSAKKFGFKKLQFYNNKDFQRTNFYKEHINITKQKRGAGYWVWKPYYIYQTLQNLDEGETLVYCDAGVDISSYLTPLLNIAQSNDKGIVLFENYQGASYFSKTTGLQVNEYNLYVEVNKNKYWTKRDVFVLMGLDNESYWDSPHIDASFQVYRKCKTSLAFVEEWLSYSCNQQILTDAPNKCGLPDFKNHFGHTHDQSIISLLVHKHGLNLYRCPSQFGNHYKSEHFRVEGEYLILPYSSQPKLNSMYATLINQHRGSVLPYWLRYKIFIKQELNILKSYWF